VIQKYGKYGYYSIELTKLNNGMKLPAGTRIIAYNTNSCDSLNFHIWGEREDPGHQFAWLEQQLMEVEAAGGLAIMIGHYTPTDCQHQFGTRYRALIERFQNVVRFGMTGHTHTEDFRVHNSMTNPEKPVFVTEVASSVTTFSGNNPSFKVIEFDKETMLPINMTTYYADIVEANKNNKPDWKIAHDYVNTYGMEDMSPSSFKDLSLRIFSDPAVREEFSFNRRARNESVDTDWSALYLYCLTATSEMHEKHHCEKTGEMSAYGSDFKMLSSKVAQATVDRIIGDWIDVSQNN